MKATTISSLLPSEQEQFEQQRYLLLKRLFQPAEVNFFRNHFMRVRESGPQPGDEVPLDMTHPDPLKRYPRLMMMHRWDEVALRFLLDNRLQNVLTALLQSEPFAVQTMLYFKPPHARGQALHQDNYFLRVRPGTCIAAWLALDECDEANGCLQVLPDGSPVALETSPGSTPCGIWNESQDDIALTGFEVVDPDGHE